MIRALRWSMILAVAGSLALGCQSEPAKQETAAPKVEKKETAKAPPPKPVPAPEPPAPAQDPLEGGPYPTLLVAQAQFGEKMMPDGTSMPVPGAAKLTVVRKTDSGWKTTLLEDPDSNVFHKAVAYDGGLLTIGGNEAMLKTWKMDGGKWTQTTHWNPTFGGRFNRCRDFEIADVDQDGEDEVVVATHDQGVIVIVHPSEDWRVEEIDAQANTFVHEIEIGDVDGDGQLEIFATPSKPNKLDEEQPGEVSMYARGENGWTKSIVDAPGDTHAKEVLAADVDQDGTAEVYIVWEGAIGQGGALVRPVTIKQYRRNGDAWDSAVVTTVPDRQMRAITAGDVNGDGKVDLVAGGLGSGLWLFEQGADGWTKSQIDADSSGFEHPVLVADIDGDGQLEVYAGAEDQGELRQHRWADGGFQSTVVSKLKRGDISWNVQDAQL